MEVNEKCQVRFTVIPLYMKTYKGTKCSASQDHSATKEISKHITFINLHIYI